MLVFVCVCAFVREAIPILWAAVSCSLAVSLLLMTKVPITGRQPESYISLCRFRGK